MRMVSWLVLLTSILVPPRLLIPSDEHDLLARPVDERVFLAVARPADEHGSLSRLTGITNMAHPILVSTKPET